MHLFHVFVVLVGLSAATPRTTRRPAYIDRKYNNCDVLTVVLREDMTSSFVVNPFVHPLSVRPSLFRSWVHSAAVRVPTNGPRLIRTARLGVSAVHTLVESRPPVYSTRPLRLEHHYSPLGFPWHRTVHSLLHAASQRVVLTDSRTSLCSAPPQTASSYQPADTRIGALDPSTDPTGVCVHRRPPARPSCPVRVCPRSIRRTALHSARSFQNKFPLVTVILRDGHARSQTQTNIPRPP